ncbi:hypothetical protein [Mesorhizobium captivum]|uniref:hypothetical protein n=1 Tax=Mesorhizobium captivum TaxID=3072319 RepID=UPI002A24C67F|nr:hypothetical protein [Mesorhizobium sp. VK23E]MDX8513572.1 hypothetical protein [Mesorhizobium sp. VK23E]
MSDVTYEVTIDGVSRTVTLAQFRAEMDRRRALAAPIAAAWHAGDKAGVIVAQKAMRSTLVAERA